MTHQYVHCPNDHKLKASPRLFGQTHPCPKCGVAVEIPSGAAAAHRLLQAEAPKKNVSDSSVMRMLGSCDRLPSPPEVKTGPELRPCPHCDLTIPYASNVCEHCHRYVGNMPAFLPSTFIGT